jgi:hypothetical protein
MIMVLLILKLFVSSHPLKLEGVYAFMFCYSMKDKLKSTLICFSIWLKHTRDFHCFIFHDLSFVFFFML